MPIDDAELLTRFTYHAPTEEQARIYGAIRKMALEMAQNIIDLAPESREQALALTHLDEVVFWTNASIARRS